MKNILIPTDFSEDSKNAIEYALGYFKNIPVNFYLLHVSHQEIIEDSVDNPRHLLATEVDFFNNFSLNRDHIFYPIFESLSLVEGIRKHLAENHIDYIVMGTKGGSTLNPIVIGSNTSEVITKVKCPVLVVPRLAKHNGIHNIAFPTDYNCIFKNKVLSTIHDMIESQNAVLHILNVKSVNSNLSEDQHINKTSLKDMLKETDHQFHFLESRTIEKGIQDFVEENGIDMIAMVAKNLNIIQRLLFKPKDLSVNYRIQLPFLVIHE